MTTIAACMCEAEVSAPDEDAFPAAFLVHVREAHPDWPYPDLTVRVVGEAILRLTGGTERLDRLGEVTTAPVMPDHLDDWLDFFDHHAFVDRPWIAACYCLEQHAPMPPPALGGWQENRVTMAQRFREGTAFGYLAFVDGRAAGWVNAAFRGDQVYALARGDDATTITVSCFSIAPPYRAHGLQAKLLDRIVADAPSRGATRIEAYPYAVKLANDVEGAFRGTLSLFESRGFVGVKDLGAAKVVRLTL